MRTKTVFATSATLLTAFVRTVTANALSMRTETTSATTAMRITAAAVQIITVGVKAAVQSVPQEADAGAALITDTDVTDKDILSKDTTSVQEETSSCGANWR